MARYNVDLQDNEGNAYQIMANPDSVAEFSPAANRENIRSGETHRIIFGKIMKYLSEVGNAAYVGLANNCTTTVAGFALDARQGKELMDRVNELNRDLHTLNDSGAIKGLDAREDGVYITYSTGADTVTKKLGSGDSVTKTFNSGVFSKSASGTINVSGYRYVLINSIQIGNPNASSSSSGRYSFGDISADFRRSPASYDNPARMPNWFDLNGREVIQWSYNSSDNDNMIVSYTLVE